MIGGTVRPASLFSFAFFKEAAAIADPVLDPFDLLLEDPELVALCTRLLKGRSTRSATFGRMGIAPDRLLRCVVLKYVKGWSFRQLERELRANLLYRRFTRFYEDPIPNFSTFSRVFGLFGTEGTAQIHQRVVQKARQAAIAEGKKLRTDTTAVETNIHHPTDSSLLADSLRVLTRSLKRIAAGCRLQGRADRSRRSREGREISGSGDLPRGENAHRGGTPADQRQLQEADGHNAAGRRPDGDGA